jgi:hypothetical protein
MSGTICVLITYGSDMVVGDKVSLNEPFQPQHKLLKKFHFKTGPLARRNQERIFVSFSFFVD